jgi:hypothetical protein
MKPAVYFIHCKQLSQQQILSFGTEEWLHVLGFREFDTTFELKVHFFRSEGAVRENLTGFSWLRELD